MCLIGLGRPETTSHGIYIWHQLVFHFVVTAYMHECTWSQGFSNMPKSVVISPELLGHFYFALVIVFSNLTHTYLAHMWPWEQQSIHVWYNIGASCQMFSYMNTTHEHPPFLVWMPGHSTTMETCWKSMPLGVRRRGTTILFLCWVEGMQGIYSVFIHTIWSISNTSWRGLT